MYTLLLFIVGGLFVAMLFVNVYFRAKVLKVYGVLVRNKGVRRRAYFQPSKIGGRNIATLPTIPK